MTVRYYRSDHAGAPVLSGTAGAYNTILDAILGSTGYNTKTITITRVGGVATANCTAHGYVADQVLIVSGAGQPEYNVMVNRPTIIDANNFSFPVTGTPATPATGTISCKVQGAGWTKAFSATNKSDWLKPGGNQFYLSVDDTGTTSATQRGYETMSASATGVNPFPTVVQIATFCGVTQKSGSASAVAVIWAALITDKTFIFWSGGGTSATFVTTGGGSQNTFYFGDGISENPGDAYFTVLFGGTANNDATSCNNCSNTGSAGHYTARNNAQAIGAINSGKYPLRPYGVNPSTVSGTAGMTYPAPTNGGFYLSEYVSADLAAVPFRGFLPGIWWTAHGSTGTLTPNDTFSGTGAYAGKRFVVLSNSNTTTGRWIFEISDTW